MQRTALAAFLVSLLLSLLIGGTIHLRADRVFWYADEVAARFERPIQVGFDAEFPFFMTELRTTYFGLAMIPVVLFFAMFALFTAVGWAAPSRDGEPRDTGRTDA